MPVYNAEKTLRRCVESLVYGSEKNIEIILVDDCSKDNSWELCQQLQSEFKNVLSVQNKHNKGVSYTRNHGLKEASAPYIMFVDSDDWVSQHFVSRLLYTVEEYESAQTICGFHYIDEVTHNKVDYQWDKQSEETLIIIQEEELFDAVDKIMLQNVWNKIFSRELIQKNNIHFDETQNMGEDFQFVLDYMKAADLHKCVVINEPLYYYVRANQTSLMSKFGWSSDENEIQRLILLKTLCGNNSDKIQKRLEQQIVNAKANRIYHVVRTKDKSKKEKITRIEEILNDGHGVEKYKEQIKLQKKENAVAMVGEVQYFMQRVQGKMQRMKRNALIHRMKSKLNNEGFSIISQNCIGGVFYHDMEMEFLSPTINLFIKPPDFVRFVLNLKEYLSMELRMEWGEAYPIGNLGDIKIHFMHYNSCTEAVNSWNRRKMRINFQKIIILSTDMEGFDDEVFEQWKQITYPKILFTVHEKYAQSGESICFPQYISAGHVLDIIPDREFYKKNILINTINRS